MVVEIRKMITEDIKTAAELEKKYFSMPWSVKSLKESLENPNAHFMVACTEEKIIGYGGMYVVCGEGEITDVVVDEDWRGRGVGRMIMQALEEEAVKVNAENILLEVRKSNVIAIRCYERCGYKAVGVRKNFYHKPVEDAVIMMLTIGE